MKLLTYESAAGPRAGVLVEDRVVDVATLLGEAGGVRDVRALLELPGAPLERLKAALAGGATEGLALGSVRLRAPILQPPTVRDHIIYEEHATQQHTREISESWYRLPVFYFSNPLRIFGPDETVPYPAASQRLDYELELGAVIGRDGSDILEAEAEPYIAGFTIFNDWSCRDLQTDEMKFGLGPAKGKDAANSLGPWVVTSDELAPYWRDGRLHLKCSVKVNGVQWMEGNAGGGHFSWGAILERDAQDSRIVPGDVIGSGTISGGSIGEAIRKGYPARFLQPGDVVEMEIEAIGVLRNTVGPIANPNKNLRWKAREQPPMPAPLPPRPGR
jgi:2-keto-4-pentenoate hydratase/2-oxohepta-3-ene-1,7-dioic acid hydratase in catechol pathway